MKLTLFVVIIAVVAACGGSTESDAAGGDVLLCDGPEDCPGKICCSQIQRSGYSEAACRDTCPRGNGLQLCHAAQECSDGACCPLNRDKYPGVGVCDAPSGQFCKP